MKTGKKKLALGKSKRNKEKPAPQQTGADAPDDSRLPRSPEECSLPPPIDASEKLSRSSCKRKSRANDDDTPTKPQKKKMKAKKSVPTCTPTPEDESPPQTPAASHEAAEKSKTPKSERKKSKKRNTDNAVQEEDPTTNISRVDAYTSSDSKNATVKKTKDKKKKKNSDKAAADQDSGEQADVPNIGVSKKENKKSSKLKRKLQDEGSNVAPSPNVDEEARKKKKKLKKCTDLAADVNKRATDQTDAAGNEENGVEAGNNATACDNPTENGDAYSVAPAQDAAQDNAREDGHCEVDGASKGGKGLVSRSRSEPELKSLMKGAGFGMRRNSGVNVVEPFKRVREEKVVYRDERLRDNSFYSKHDTFGELAHNALVVTKGKGFRKEKTKKKRANHHGGKLNYQVNSFKFPDDSE